MENQVKEKVSKPKIEVPLTSIELSQILDGEEFTWECKDVNTNETVTVLAYLDSGGIFVQE